MERFVFAVTLICLQSRIPDTEVQTDRTSADPAEHLSIQSNPFIPDLIFSAVFLCEASY